MDPLGRRHVIREHAKGKDYPDISLRAYPQGIAVFILWDSTEQGAYEYEFGMSTSESRHLSTAFDSVVRDL